MANIESPPNQAKLSFGTKAETLSRLADHCSAKILPQLTMTVEQWTLEPKSCVEKLASLGWLNEELIIRSSARTEDSLDGSMAGHYKSFLRILGEEAILNAVAGVAASYGADCNQEQILVQPMLAEVAASGVAFSFDPNTGSAYRVVSFDETTHSTESVTSGTSNQLRTFYCFKGASTDSLPNLVKLVIQLLDELCVLFGEEHIDIEFAQDKKGQLYLLQCRPLLANSGSTACAVDLSVHLQKIQEKMQRLQKMHPYLLGKTSVFGVMPDWNPAEIIGTKPRPLALSLYQELITDSIWAYQRDNYGYRNVRSFPLLVSFCGLPYVDVRVDFNSFVPADIDDELGHRLVDYYLEKLIQSPSDHDKVEFEVVLTCYTFDLAEQTQRLSDAGFSNADRERLIASLRNLTNKIIRSKEGLWQKDIGKIKRLEARQASILQSDLDLVSKIYWLLEDCKRYGTLPFAGLARAAFIAVRLLKSLVHEGVLTSGEYDRFMASLTSVGSSLTHDFQTTTREEFLAKYGHLRPGTYELTSARYDEEPDKYFDWSRSTPPLPSATPEFSLSLDQFKRIENLLEHHQLEHNVLGFFDFLRAAIEGRELAKFVFTKSISDALSLFKQLGLDHGFSSEDCSFANIGCIKKLYASTGDPLEVLTETINNGRKEYELTSRLRLPPLMVTQNDVWCVGLPPSEPNFITQKAATGKVVIAGDTALQLRDSIYFIPSADPGYDWIFSHGVKGLVTMYGGVNSHMAVRAGELGIAAVIGAGELLYNQWAQAEVLHIDCGARQVWRVK